MKNLKMTLALGLSLLQITPGLFADNDGELETTQTFDFPATEEDPVMGLEAVENFKSVGEAPAEIADVAAASVAATKPDVEENVETNQAAMSQAAAAASIEAITANSPDESDPVTAPQAEQGDTVAPTTAEPKA